MGAIDLTINCLDAVSPLISRILKKIITMYQKQWMDQKAASLIKNISL